MSSVKKTISKHLSEAGPAACAIPQPRRFAGPPEWLRRHPRLSSVLKWFFLTIFLFINAASKLHAADISHSIDAIQTTYQQTADISADFTQESTIALLNKKVIRRGRFFLKKGGTVRIEYHVPEKQNYVSDGEHLWIYAPGDVGSLTTARLDDGVVPKEALAFLTGFGKLKKEFHITPSQRFIGLQSGFTALHLKPRSKKAPFKNMDALFNANHILVDLILLNNAGDETIYRFSKIRVNSGLSEDLFSVPLKLL